MQFTRRTWLRASVKCCDSYLFQNLCKYTSRSYFIVHFIGCWETPINKVNVLIYLVLSVNSLRERKPTIYMIITEFIRWKVQKKKRKSVVKGELLQTWGLENIQIHSFGDPHHWSNGQNSWKGSSMHLVRIELWRYTLQLLSVCGDLLWDRCWVILLLSCTMCSSFCRYLNEVCWLRTFWRQ